MSHKTYESLLLDWDGNLAQTLDIWLDAYQTVLRQYGYQITNEDVCANFTRFTSYSEELGVSKPIEAMMLADQIASKHLPLVELYPDAEEVIKNLYYCGKSLALITSSTARHVVAPLERHKLTQYFGSIVTGDQVERRKPDPESLNKAINALCTSAEVSLVVGDSETDIKAANHAGVDSVLFFPSDHQRFYSLKVLRDLQPTYVIEDLKQLLEIVK